VFRTITLRGVRGSILWGYRTAAALPSWTVQKTVTGTWVLFARVERADAFICRQRPLYFSAPRRKGMWCWPVTSVQLRDQTLRANLAPPEQ
jgi:hypothetical protein